MVIVAMVMAETGATCTTCECIGRHKTFPKLSARTFKFM